MWCNLTGQHVAGVRQHIKACAEQSDAHFHGDCELARALRLAILLRPLPLGPLNEVRMVADFAQDVNASQGSPVAGKDGVNLLAVQVGSVHVALVLAQLAEQHLKDMLWVLVMLYVMGCMQQGYWCQPALPTCVQNCARVLKLQAGVVQIVPIFTQLCRRVGAQVKLVGMLRSRGR